VPYKVTECVPCTVCKKVKVCVCEDVCVKRCHKVPVTVCEECNPCDECKESWVNRLFHRRMACDCCDSGCTSCGGK
jgi:hypothetical protein